MVHLDLAPDSQIATPYSAQLLPFPSFNPAQDTPAQ